jgi:hypothetical protein
MSCEVKSSKARQGKARQGKERKARQGKANGKDDGLAFVCATSFTARFPLQLLLWCNICHPDWTGSKH